MSQSPPPADTPAVDRPVSPSRQAMEDKLKEMAPSYTEAYHKVPEMRSFIGRHLSSRPDHAKVIELIPMDEYERRLEALERIRSGQRSKRGDDAWDFTATQFSMLMTMPLPHLENPPGLYELHDMLNKTDRLLNHFLQTSKFDDDATLQAKRDKKNADQRAKRAKEKAAKAAPSTEAGKAPASSAGPSKAETEAPGTVEDKKPTAKSKPIDRDPDARAEAKALDKNRCLVTHTADPEGCHILPFAWVSTADNLAKTESLKMTMARCFGLDRDVDTDLRLDKAFEGLGSADKAWNMLFLSPCLHTWWGKGTWALKWHGVLPVDEKCPEETRVQLQFVWLPRSQSDRGGRRISLEDQRDPEKRLLAGLTHQYGSEQVFQCTEEDCKVCTEADGYRALDIRTNHPVLSGHIITVARKTEDIPSFKLMIDLQWALLRVAAMSGAAQAPELLVGDDDDDDDYDRIDLWLSQVSESQDPEEILSEAPDEVLSQIGENKATQPPQS